MKPTKLFGDLIDIGDDFVCRKMLAQMRTDMLGKYSMLPTEQQRRVIALSTEAVNGDHRVYVFDETLKSY
jgi:hypothetical protein